MSVEVEVVDAVDPTGSYDEATVRSLLRAPPLMLDHGGEFTGRPTTTVRATARHVLKERPAGAWASSREGLRHMVEEVCERERTCRVHPPTKTWFLIQSDRELWVGNVTPRLTPLHLPETQLDPMRFRDHLHEMLRMYMRVAAVHGIRLDEGLSNFAHDEQGRLYYVDDDLYVWDEFVHFSQGIGIILRKSTVVSPAMANMLGEEARSAIVSAFGTAEPCRGIAEAVRGLFFNGPRQYRRRDAFLRGLVGTGPRHGPRRAVPSTHRIALLADVHANLPALRAVLSDVRGLGISQGLVLGDLVGYGPHPQACLSELRKTRFEILRGNHDEAVATGVRVPGFNRAAFEVVTWTRDQLDEAELAWLGQLPVRIERDGWRAQHGAPIDPTYFNAYVYRMTYEDNLHYLREQNLRLAFHGHTHTPSVYFATTHSSGLAEGSFHSLADYQQALVCPGSVGQPRRGGTAAQWAVLDLEAQEVEFRSVAYDLEQTLDDMATHQFPTALIDRLRTGS